MLIVAIDTSGRNGSVGLYSYFADGGGGFDFKGELKKLTGGSYSAELIPRLDELLVRKNISKSAIDAFAVATGPGSFTGLRVGLSTVKALADALNKPIAAVSVLEAIAAQSATDGHFLVALDAGRKQVYVGEFQVNGREYLSLSERLLDVAQFAEELKTSPVTVFTPDDGIAEALRTCECTGFIIQQPMADAYARIGAERILAGNIISPAELDANYLRRSDAEIFFRGSR